MYDFSCISAVYIHIYNAHRDLCYAKLIFTSTSHMVAALVLLDNEPTLLTLPIVQVLLKEHDLLLVTFSYVHSQQTF